MKYFIYLSILLGGFSLLAQKKLDTLDYQNYQNQRFPKAVFDTTFVTNRLTTEEKIQALSTVWHEAKFNFANFDLVPTLNWDSLYRAYLPKVMATDDIMDTYRVLMKFNQHLRDGHTRILPPLYHFKKQKMNKLPIRFKNIDGKAVVYQINSKEKEYARLKPGMILEKIDDVAVQDYIKANISPTLHFSTIQDSIGRIYHYELLSGSENTEVILDLRTAEGKMLQKSFKRIPYKQNLKSPVIYKVLPGNIGHLIINNFAEEATFTEFKKHFSDIVKSNALIIDIRHNGGGNSHWGNEIIGYLTSEPFYPSMTMMNSYHPAGRAWGGKAIESKKTAYDWKPYHTETYTKPVVVLISELTYSAAEDFSSSFKSAKRGILMGTTTGGSTGQPLAYPLPGGGIGFVCTKRDAMSDGLEFVGVGIHPDVYVKPTINGLQNGEDEVLNAALKYLKQFKSQSM